MFPSSELVLDAKNNVYHLGLNASQIADKIIVVGDQERVSLIGGFFDSILVLVIPSFSRPSLSMELHKLTHSSQI